MQPNTPSPSSAAAPAELTRRAERALDVLNVVLADVRYGLGPYAAIYLMAEHGWNEAMLAVGASMAGITGLLSQVPIGAMVDKVRAKRALLAGALLLATSTAFIILVTPAFWPLALGGVVGAVAGCALGTTLAAISLGIVGKARFARRAARNEALFHAGSAGINVLILALAPVFGLSFAFWMLAVAAIGSVLAVVAIPRDAIDLDAARGLAPSAEQHGVGPSPLTALLQCRPLVTFALCGALFHMANATMLGLVVQRATRADPGTAMQLAAACMITAQIAMVGTATLAGARADSWGRRPIFLAAFAALTIRGILYTVSEDSAWTIAVQLLDGVGVGVFGALFPVVIADLAQGSGRFSAAQGGVGTIHSVGGITGGLISGTVVVWFDYDTAFLTLSAIAALGFLLYWYAMPETRGAGAGCGTIPAPATRAQEALARYK
jgi:MFS family permease